MFAHVKQFTISVLRCYRLGFRVACDRHNSIGNESRRESCRCPAGLPEDHRVATVESKVLNLQGNAIPSCRA